MATDKNANKKERHILALSGGKDSAALAVYMRDQHPDDVVGVMDVVVS
jgi:tRNA(Ile)-lysidine synthase TilS/MesJ